MAQYGARSRGVDNLSPEARSENMRRIRGSNTSPELLVRRLLRRAGIRTRRYPKDLPGHPDFVAREFRFVIFVNGCFWHGHYCTGGRRPKSNRTYWDAKLERNVRRDRRIAQKLRREGWKRLVVWECELQNMTRIEAKLTRIMSA